MLTLPQDQVGLGQTAPDSGAWGKGQASGRPAQAGPGPRVPGADVPRSRAETTQGAKEPDLR